MFTGRRAALAAAACSAGLIVAATGVGARAETLPDAIALAYDTNPTLQAQRASQRALDETYVQARTGYRPVLTATGSVTTSDTSPTPLFTANPVNSSGVTLNLTQPLYTGGRVSSAVTAAEADVLAGREGLRRVEQSVLQSVIQAYVDVRRDQERLAISQDNVNVLQRQLQESNARFEVGEITRTDVAQTQARLAAAQALFASAQAQLAISRASYAAVVGQNPGELAPEPPIQPLLPATVEQAFDAAEHNNPQIRQSDYTEQGSAARVAAAKAQTRPSVSLRGSLGWTGGSVGGGSPFVDYSRNVTASAVINQNIFTGGLITSQVRQAAERNNIDRIGIEGARRQVLQLVSQSWNQLLGARANLVANEEQVRAAAIAFEGTRQEAQVGLRTTLDVLNTEQDLRNAQFALVNARHDEYVAGAAVLAAMGALNAKAMANVQVYDPKANFDHVKHSFGWVPWEPVVAAVDHVGAPGVVHRPTPVAPPAPAQ
jgi:outer membrane protein